MQILVNKDEVLRTTVVRLLHRGEELIWRAKAFERTELQKEADAIGTDIQEKNIFGLINQYWENLEQAEQDEMFGLYKKIKEAMETPSSTDALTRAIRPYVTTILDKFHDQDRVRVFVDYHGGIIIPENVKDKMTFEQGSQITESKTYLREDYRRLVTLAVTMRCMIPIWGDFIERSKGDQLSDHTHMKEITAYRLLAESKIMRCPAMEKLKAYIENMVPPVEEQVNVLLKGISSEDYLRWQMARVMVRRVCIGDVRGHTPSANIIRFIHQFADQRNSGQAAGGRKAAGGYGNVVEKFKHADTDEESNNLSRFEGYKTPAKNSAGTIKTYEVYLLNYQNAAERLLKFDDSPFDVRLIEECVAGASVLMNARVARCIIPLAQWFVSNIVSPHCFTDISKQARCNAIGLAQARLWLRGHYEVAALLTATQVENDTLFLYDDTGRVKLNKEQVEILDQLFPFKRRIGNKTSGKLVNPVLDDIAAISKEFADKEWRINLSDRMIKESGLVLSDRHYVPNKNLQNSIINAVIDIFRRKSNVQVSN